MELNHIPSGHVFSVDGDYRWLEPLFDAITDTVYFIKDASGRYVSVNQTLVERCGLATKAELLGKTAAEIMPDQMGNLILKQDINVVASQSPIKSKLELHLYTGGREGWCLTWKEPLFGPDGRVAGLSGISRDLQPRAEIRSDFANVSAVLDHILDNLTTPLRIPVLAKLAGLSEYQLDKRVKALFGLSLGQYITRERISLACTKLLQSGEPISQIALDCGYSDQAAFTRQFRLSVGLTPAGYRKKADVKLP